MSSDQPYTPDEQAVEVAWIEFEASDEDINEAAAEFDRFLARVRRDAAREALDGYAASLDALTAPYRHLEGDRVRHWRDTHYPEETP